MFLVEAEEVVFLSGKFVADYLVCEVAEVGGIAGSGFFDEVDLVRSDGVLKFC